MIRNLKVFIIERKFYVLDQGNVFERPFFEAAVFIEGLKPTPVVRRDTGRSELMTIPAVKAAARAVSLRLGFNGVVYKKVDESNESMQKRDLVMPAFAEGIVDIDPPRAGIKKRRVIHV